MRKSIRNIIIVLALALGFVAFSCEEDNNRQWNCPQDTPNCTMPIYENPKPGRPDWPR